MPDILEILHHDIEKIVLKLYKDIYYQRSLKRIKLSNKSFRKLMNDGFPVLFGNYKRALADVGGGSLLRDNRTSKQEFDAFEIQSREFYNQILTQLFLQSKNDKRTLRNDRLILTCTVIAAITGIISLFRF
ncbi:hypothetical protein SCR15_04025 [Legionella pneumophila serogroup 1]|nr:hypothetical protein [Legionella pneumophila]MDW8908351.1 hypothetical protein [Legionella pneumophila]HAT9117805.1 hypothetical protein [Legionella pneumophila subsp. pneumophila]HAU1476179.1 hypothetical protein [Legionella pneumophila]